MAGIVASELGTSLFGCRKAVAGRIVVADHTVAVGQAFAEQVVGFPGSSYHRCWLIRIAVRSYFADPP